MVDLRQTAALENADGTNNTFNIVTTDLIRQKLAKALAETGRIPVIKYLAFGTGGVDQDNVPIPPDPTMNALRNEAFRLPVESVEYPVPTTADITVYVESAEYNGTEISEFGAIDEDGDFIGIQSMQVVTKQDRVTLKFHWYCEF